MESQIGCGRSCFAQEPIATRVITLVVSGFAMDSGTLCPKSTEPLPVNNASALTPVTRLRVITLRSITKIIGNCNRLWLLLIGELQWGLRRCRKRHRERIHVRDRNQANLAYSTNRNGKEFFSSRSKSSSRITLQSDQSTSGKVVSPSMSASTCVINILVTRGRAIR